MLGEDANFVRCCSRQDEEKMEMLLSGHFEEDTIKQFLLVGRA